MQKNKNNNKKHIKKEEPYNVLKVNDKENRKQDNAKQQNQKPRTYEPYNVLSVNDNKVKVIETNKSITHVYVSCVSLPSRQV